MIKLNAPIVSIIIVTHNRNEKLIRLIESILTSNFPMEKIEIIVVDDASNDGTYDIIKTKYPYIKIIRTSKEVLPSAARNIGISYSKGKYIFIIDDDNVLSNDTIAILVDTLEKNPTIGIVAPIMYYYQSPNRVWCAGVRRNMVTSITKFVGNGMIDNGQFKELIESPDFPNAFMVRRAVIEKVGLFDYKLFPIYYEEGDFGERVRRAGYKVVCNPKAKDWHDIPLPEHEKDKLTLYHLDTPIRVYYYARNRIIFHAKYSKKWEFLIFLCIFNWIIMSYYMAIILMSKRPWNKRLNLLRSYLRGVYDGLRYVHYWKSDTSSRDLLLGFQL